MGLIILLFLCLLPFAYIQSALEKGKEVDRLANETHETEVELVRVITKRNYNSGEINVGTKYYVTFEFEKDNSRKEFEISGESYGFIAEGDKGELSYKGDKFIKFVRIVE